MDNHYNLIPTNLTSIDANTANMVSATSALITIAAAAGLLQMCPAPPAIVAAVAGGVAAGAVGGGATLCARYCPGMKNPKRIQTRSKKIADLRPYTTGPNGKRDFEVFARQLPPGVSQESINQCTGQINDQQNNGGSVQISDVSEGCKCSTINLRE